MFYYIKGKVALKGLNFAVIEAGGVGFRIFTSAVSLSRIEEGGDAVMYTYMYVREDTMNIYGFSTSEELSMFENLISVNGVGPKAALSIMSVAPPEQFAVAVLTENTKLITSAQGIGPKTAKRIVLELKDKLKNSYDASADAGEAFDVPTVSDSKTEAVNALMVLGYSHDEASKALKDCDAQESTEQLVKQALKNLLKG